MSITKSEWYGIIIEHFDITDTETRKVLLSIDEEDQSQVLTDLTSKLYDSIVHKITEIDFGTIPDTNGDITKMENFDQMVDCLDTMESLLETYKQDTAPAVTVKKAIANLAARKDMFEKAFRYDIEMPIVMYNTLALACVASTSYLISTCVEFIKSPSDESFTISLNKTGSIKTQESLMFRNLQKFNTSCDKGEFDKCMEHVISTKVKNLIGGVPTGVGLLAIGAIAGILLSIIPVMRELIFAFYLSRVKMADYFEVQADLLEMNAANVETSTTLDPKKRKLVAKRQSNIASGFRKVANVVEVKTKDADSKAMKEIGSSNKKMKIKDVTDKMPDSAAASLF